jgi:uncharacterized protein YjbJ (UPF0337 family)
LAAKDVAESCRAGWLSTCNVRVARLSADRPARTTRLKERAMKPSTKDQMQGKVHEIKGKVKEKIGNATNNPDKVAEGVDEKTAGKIQKKIGQVEKVFEK